MKKLIVLAGLLLMPGMLMAMEAVWNSTNTATADTTKALCLKSSLGSRRRGVVHAVSVNTGVAGTFTVYNSSGAAANPIAAIDTATKSYHVFDVVLSTGITYTNSATANVTLLYSCN